jgi:hypothetical protein
MFKTLGFGAFGFDLFKTLTFEAYGVTPYFY